MRLPFASPLLVGLALLAASPLPAAQPDPPAAEAPKSDAAMTGWVRQVHAIVLKATASLGRRLAPGAYRVGFTVDERGRGSNYGIGGDRPDAKQSSMIVGALISRSFPAPPDGASHAVSFTLRNGPPTGRAAGGGKAQADDKTAAGGAKP